MEPTCAAFLAHWQRLRQGTALPTVSAFLDHASPAHAPWIFMAEVEGDVLRVRLEGTGLVARWGRDLTGDRLFRDKSAAYVAKVAANFRAVIVHPCGYYALNHYVSGRGREVTARVLYLPLAGDSGRPPRVVGYSTELSGRSHDDTVLTNRRETLEASWVDLGAGVPTYPPNRAVE